MEVFARFFDEIMTGVSCGWLRRKKMGANSTVALNMVGAIKWGAGRTPCR